MKDMHSLIGAFLLSTLALGCGYPKDSGTALEKRVSKLEKEQAQVASDLSKEREHVAEALAKLEAVLEKATRVVKRNSADLGAEVEGLQSKLASIDGKLAELENQNRAFKTEVGESQLRMGEKLETFARRAGVDMPVDEAKIPKTEDEHFAAAYRAFRDDKHSFSRGLFREFVRRYPDSKNLDNALYWTGKSYLIQKKPAMALRHFRKILTDHAKGDVIDDALFDMADAFVELRACSDAKAALDALIKSQSGSPLRSKAKKKLRRIRKLPAAQCAS